MKLRRPSYPAGAAAAAVTLALFGVLMSLEPAPRSAANAIPTDTSGAARSSPVPVRQVPSGNLSRPPGAPLVSPMAGSNLSPSDAAATDDEGTPDVELGTAIEAGLASYCAPTPNYCQSWGRPAKLAAVPEFRYGDRPYSVRVCHQEHEGRCTVALVVSFCACGNKIIDLSPAAFEALDVLSRGVIPVTVQRVSGVPLPATETEP